MDEFATGLADALARALVEPDDRNAPVLLAMLFSASVRALLIWDSWRIGP